MFETLREIMCHGFSKTKPTSLEEASGIRVAVLISPDDPSSKKKSILNLCQKISISLHITPPSRTRALTLSQQPSGAEKEGRENKNDREVIGRKTREIDINAKDHGAWQDK